MNIDTYAGASLQSVACGTVLQALGASGAYDLRSIPGLPRHAFAVEERGAIIAVTDMPAPLFRRAVHDAAMTLQYDVLLLRIDEDPDAVRADLTLGFMPGEPFVLDNMALYEAENGGLWLVPPTFGAAVSISPEGFILELLAPYDTLDDRAAGVVRARYVVEHLLAPEEVR